MAHVNAEVIERRFEDLSVGALFVMGAFSGGDGDHTVFQKISDTEHIILGQPFEHAFTKDFPFGVIEVELSQTQLEVSVKGVQ